MADGRCDTCKADKVCDHDRFGFENCDNYISEDCVEVVRCRDCEHWKRVGFDNIFEKDFGECRCEFWADDSWMDDCRKETLESDFCSNGERKETNNG